MSGTPFERHPPFRPKKVMFPEIVMISFGPNAPWSEPEASKKTCDCESGCPWAGHPRRLSAATTMNGRKEKQDIRAPPKTAFRSWVDGGSSVFGVAGFIAASSVCIFLMFDLPLLISFRSFLVLIFAFQAAVRGSPDSESGFVMGQVVDQVDQAKWPPRCATLRAGGRPR